MKTFAKIALCVAAASAAACAVVHRRVIVAWITGGPVPEPPEWHTHCHPCKEQED